MSEEYVIFYSFIEWWKGEEYKESLAQQDQELSPIDEPEPSSSK